MRILVAGGAGFLGSNLCERLAKDPENFVYCLDNLQTGWMENIRALTGKPNLKFIRRDIVESIEGERQLDAENRATVMAEAPAKTSEQTVSTSRAYRFIKRAFDIAASVAALVILSPLILVLAAVIKLDSPGPMIHKRWCAGKDGPYAMLKFRTMAADADDIEKYFQGERLEAYLKGIKVHDDPRITKAGRILRKTSLDELPQLVNVLRGDMSIVGPRPVIEREAAEYGADREKLLSCRAGITGCWQVAGRGDIPYLSDEAKSLQLYYVEHQSLGLDVRLLLKTVQVVLSRKGAR